MAIHYYRDVGRFRDSSGRFVSKTSGLKSSIGRAEFRKVEEWVIVERETKLWEHERMGFVTSPGPSLDYLDGFFEDYDIDPEQEDDYVED